MKIVGICVPEFHDDKKTKHTVTVMFWFKSEGQSVKAGEELLEIQTDKAVLDIESPATGKLKKIIAHPGDEISPGQKIGEIIAGGD